MGCIVSFLRTFRSYHGSHLTPAQVQRQRMQRSQKPKDRPTRPPTPPSSPEEEERQTLSFDGGHASYHAMPTQHATSTPYPTLPSSTPPIATPKARAKRFFLGK